MKPVRHHVPSLDVFRGLAVAGMIVVNNPGNWSAVYRPLVHAPWNGFTLADAIFPSFIFITGVTMPFAFGRRAETALRSAMLRKIATRAAVLVLMGLVLNVADGWPHLSTFRVPGVLQRIGLAYGLAAPIVLLTDVPIWMGSAVLLLAFHTGVLLLIPFGGQPAGILTPAHNVPGLVDAAVFGRHMFTRTFDPEGVVGTLSTTATMLCGAVAGAWCRATNNPARRVTALLVCGTVALTLGLCWSIWLPVNKNMWTGSYALVTAGLAALLFAVCALLVDVRGWDGWAKPFTWLGANPLAIYFLSELSRHVLDLPWVGPTASIGAKDAFFWRYLVPLVGEAGGARSSLFFALAVTAFWTAIAGLLHKRGIRIRA